MPIVMCIKIIHIPNPPHLPIELIHFHNLDDIYAFYQQRGLRAHTHMDSHAITLHVLRHTLQRRLQQLHEMGDTQYHTPLQDAYDALLAVLPRVKPHDLLHVVHDTGHCTDYSQPRTT